MVCVASGAIRNAKMRIEKNGSFKEKIERVGFKVMIKSGRNFYGWLFMSLHEYRNNLSQTG
jgi:hypothetical protein